MARRLRLQSGCSWLMLSLGLACAASAEEIRIVAPNIYTNAEADTYIGPLPAEYRGQYLFGASEFASVPEGNNTIVQMSFRPDASVNHPITFTVERWLLRLSTTTTSVDQMDPVFAANIGADETIVYDGPWTVTTSATGPPGGPKDFDYTLRFQQPFVYDPSRGNLLVDFTAWGSSSEHTGDFQLSSPSLHAIYTYEVDSPNSEGAFGGGGILEFVFVPEPSSFLLICAGLATFSGIALRRRNAVTSHGGT